MTSSNAIAVFHPPPRLSTLQHLLSAQAANIMVPENIFHERGITLLYRTFNIIIQSVLYGKFRILISILWSN